MEQGAQETLNCPDMISPSYTHVACKRLLEVFLQGTKVFILNL